MSKVNTDVHKSKAKRKAVGLAYSPYMDSDKEPLKFKKYNKNLKQNKIKDFSPPSHYVAHNTNIPKKPKDILKESKLSSTEKSKESK